ncbi:MAG: GDP-mannose 4,6-dehydratase [Vicinamibacterales bacterium]
MSTARHVPLVTGATGFAGSHLLERLLRSHEQVAGWAHTGGRPHADDSGRVLWRHVDLLDRASVEAAIRELQPTVVYHCGGLPHVVESWANAGRALQVNALGTHHLLDAVRATSPGSRVVVAGSALVYRPANRALREEDPLAPSDPYGVSKLAQEMLALRATTPVVATRPFNHIGPRQQPSFSTSSFAKQIADIEAGRREPVLLVGNLDARRDLTDVRDTARAYEALGATGIPGRVYNICTGTALRVGDVLERLLDLARVRVDVRQDPARLRPSDNPLVLGDPSRLAADTGWHAEIPIEQTLEDLLAFWRAQVP